jgi:hypothetical protein
MTILDITINWPGFYSTILAGIVLGALGLFKHIIMKPILSIEKKLDMITKHDEAIKDLDKEVYTLKKTSVSHERKITKIEAHLFPYNDLDGHH